MRTVPVLIAGGGPVGLTLAFALARLGVRSLLVERNNRTTAHPKMDMTNTRTMELFRRLGLAAALRNVAVPEDHPVDVSWVSSMVGQELHRFRYPSVIRQREDIRANNDGSEPLEPPMRVSQVEIEPVLKAANEAHPLVQVRYGVALKSFEQHANGVTARLAPVEGPEETVCCEYLAGCDGGNSTVRAGLDIPCTGRWRIMPRYMVHFQSDAYDVLRRWGLAWHHQSNRGTLVSQNGFDIWTLHARFPENVAPDSVDPSAQIDAFVGARIPHRVLVANSWTPHLVVADRYSQGRVFLAGDASHQYIPTGGYGMNTGVADAVGLAWMLAATLHGFGGPHLLGAHGLERRPVGQRNCAASERHNDVRVAIANLYEPAVRDADAAGEAARRRARDGIAALGNAENESRGIEYGYSYADSPILWHETGVDAPQDPLRYQPTTIPGVRLPSVFLSDGTALFDLLGPWFTLLCFDDSRVDAFVAAAALRNVPLQVLRLREPELQPIFQSWTVLVRPDQHVAWRGAMPRGPADADRVLARVLGWTVD